MVLRNSGRVGSRRFFDRIDRKAEGSGSNKRTGPFVILEGDALPTIPSGNDLKCYMGTSFRIGQGMVVGC